MTSTLNKTNFEENNIMKNLIKIVVVGIGIVIFYNFFKNPTIGFESLGLAIYAIFGIVVILS
jgi:hypothetical protein